MRVTSGPRPDACLGCLAGFRVVDASMAEIGRVQRWVNHLFMLLAGMCLLVSRRLHWSRFFDVTDPPGWKRRCAHDLKSGICGVKPLDAIFNNMFSNPSVMYHVMPLPRASSTGSSGEHAASSTQLATGRDRSMARPRARARAKANHACLWQCVSAMGFEPMRTCVQWILSPPPICFGYNTKKGCASHMGIMEVIRWQESGYKKSRFQILAARFPSIMNPSDAGAARLELAHTGHEQGRRPSIHELIRSGEQVFRKDG